MDDEGLGFSSVLPVAEGKLDDESFEMELPPADGLDYLRRVRYASLSCPPSHYYHQEPEPAHPYNKVVPTIP